MNIRKIQIQLFGCLVLLFTTVPLGAQTKARDARVILLQKPGEETTRVIRVGDKMNYKLITERRARRGRLEAIGDSSFTLKGRTVRYADQELIAARDSGMEATGLALMLIPKVMEALLGLALIYYLLISLSQGTGNFWQTVIFAGLISFISNVLFVIGVVIFATARKRYRMDEGWRVRVEKRTVN